MLDVTRTLAQFVVELDYDDIPPEVVQRAKTLMLDLVGIGIRARYDADSTMPMMRATEILGADGGTCGVFGDTRWFSPAAAALLNGALGHSLDFDDTHAASSVNPSTVVVPAVLAAAQLPGASGREALAAIVAGYEVICRLGQALGPDGAYERGHHPTATCGAFAATAAAGKVMGLSVEELENAFGIALSLTSGSIQFLENGAWTLRYQVGNAAKNGLVAASFAREGFIGASHPIEGRHGFLNSYAPAPMAEKAVHGLGEVWETMAIAVKAYPGCRFAHSAIDALIDLRREHDFDPGDIVSVAVGLSRKGHEMTGTPEAQKRTPDNIVDAQFSMHFLAAVALLEGHLLWDDFKTHLNDRVTEALMQRISVFHDARLAQSGKGRHGASISVALRDGTLLERFYELPKGEFGNFLTSVELRAKFRSLVAPCIGSAAEAALFDAVMNLEDESIDDIFYRTMPPAAVVLAGED